MKFVYASGIRGGQAARRASSRGGAHWSPTTLVPRCTFPLEKVINSMPWIWWNRGVNVSTCLLILREPTGQAFYGTSTRKSQRYRRPATKKRHEDGLLASRVLWLPGTTQWTQPPRVSLRLSCLFMLCLVKRDRFSKRRRGTRPFANCSPNALTIPAAGSPVTLCLRGFDSRMGMRHVPRFGGRLPLARRCIHSRQGGCQGVVFLFLVFCQLFPRTFVFLPSFHRYTAATTFVLTSATDKQMDGKQIVNAGNAMVCLLWRIYGHGFTVVIGISANWQRKHVR